MQETDADVSEMFAREKTDLLVQSVFDFRAFFKYIQAARKRFFRVFIPQ
jgi:hypothetical protein